MLLFYRLFWIAVGLVAGSCGELCSQECLRKIGRQSCTQLHVEGGVQASFKLTGAGFHRNAELERNAVVSVILKRHYEDVASQDYVILLFHISKNVYFDTDELAYQAESGVLAGEVVHFDHISTELPSDVAKDHVMLYYDKLNCSTNWCHVAVSLPIHLRYQPAHKHFPYYSFFLPPPLLLLQRTNHIPQLSLDTSNSSYSLPCTAHSDDECDWSCVNPVGETWCRQKGECKSTVPRGVQEWTWIVMVVTVCVVNGGTAVLVATMAKIL